MSNLPAKLASSDQCADIRAGLKAVCNRLGIQAEDVEIIARLPLSGGPLAIAEDSLRFNIQSHIRKSRTIGEALSGEVFGKPGSKHGPETRNPYRIKMVDIGFAIANGLIDTDPRWR